MPAVNYEYGYARQYRNNQGVVRNATSRQSYQKMSAQQKVSSRPYINSNIATKKRKYNQNSIDVPVTVKKKIVLQKPEEMKLTQQSKVSVQNKNKTEKAKKSIITTVFAFGVLFLICTRYAQINELTHKVNSLEKDLANVESLNQQLSAQVDSKTDLNYIEKYAKYQLGMQKPDEKQIVRIAYDKQDRISTPIVITEEKEPSFFEKLIKDLRNLID